MYALTRIGVTTFYYIHTHACFFLLLAHSLIHLQGKCKKKPNKQNKFFFFLLKQNQQQKVKWAMPARNLSTSGSNIYRCHGQTPCKANEELKPSNCTTLLCSELHTQCKTNEIHIYTHIVKTTKFIKHVALKWIELFCLKPTRFETGVI